LKKGGCGLLSLKAASERWSEGGDDSRFDSARKLIDDSEKITLVEEIDISHFEEQHRIYFCQRL
jgi:hypothetical protein